MYFRTVGKNGHPSLEQLTGDTVDISEWLEFEVYDLVQFWNNQSDDIKPMLGRWMVVSNMVGSSLRYWIISDKVKVLYQTTVQHLTAG